MNELSLKYKKYQKIIFIVSLVLFAISLIITKFNLNSLSILIITIPIFQNKIYEKCFNNEEHIEYIKTIITNKKYKKNEIKLLSKAGVKVIESEKEDKIKKELTYYDFDNKINAIDEIYESRGKHDNFIRTLKFNMLINIILVIPFIFFNIIGFPFMYQISLAILIKVIMILLSIFVYPYLPYDTDIMTRKPKPQNIFIGKEELYLVAIQSILIIFTLTIPYMFLLANGATYELVNTIFLIGFVYSILFLTIVNLSEKIFFINMIKILKNIRLIVLLISTILLSLFFYYIPTFNTKQISLQNYISIIIFVLLGVVLFDITKFARFTTVKGSKKYERKNNKKHRRS